MVHKLIDNEQDLDTWEKIFTDYIRSIDSFFDSGHKIDHILRVTKTAKDLAQKEDADFHVVVPASILHETVCVSKFDSQSSKASQLSAEKSLSLLKEWGYPDKYLLDIKHAIETHSFSANIEPQTLEAKVVQDADRLDALGSIGIARALAVGFGFGNSLYHDAQPFPIKRVANDKRYIVDHFYVKLYQIPATLHTQAAKQEAARRCSTMSDYLKSLSLEIGADFLSFSDYQARLSLIGQ